LNALVLLYQITGTDPRMLGPKEQAAAALGVSSSDAVTLQRIAYEQVHGAPTPPKGLRRIRSPSQLPH
jgi:hypothetical protein